MDGDSLMKHYVPTYAQGLFRGLSIPRHEFLDRVDQDEMKNAALYLCRAYRNGTIPAGLFEEVVRHLLAFYVEATMEGKQSGFCNALNEKVLELVPPEALAK